MGKLLRQPVYAQLLEGKLERLSSAAELQELAGPVELAPERSLEIVRRWIVSWVDICSFARGFLGPGKRGSRVKDTLNEIDEAVAG